ncbi:hypothetical protein GPA19_10935 [Azoarcus indigens]|uniref:Uncharacterized protein n=1 Tax=Azoarcus indigens TaxID=29545 RepID=A0A4R6E693_9RHOO|nr:hypothetical protein [Azoarcus indigens]NMG65464.1 hypothetical protein [Azoarcus indigens]TDN53436.1 hypothetical protein C7389_105109 [Azoarcus indigens]
MKPTTHRRPRAALCSAFACPRSPLRRMQRALGLLISTAGLLIWLSGSMPG